MAILPQNAVCSDDVKNMMKDILLIWTAVKQLDAAKADRKEVENIGFEFNSRNEVLPCNYATLWPTAFIAHRRGSSPGKHA